MVLQTHVPLRGTKSSALFVVILDLGSKEVLICGALIQVGIVDLPVCFGGKRNTKLRSCKSVKP